MLYCIVDVDMLDEQIHVRIDAETLKELNELAKAMGLNRSQLIRLAIKTFIRNSKLLDALGVLHE